MEKVSMRELNQDTARVMARVERGEPLEITNRGRTVARLTPVTGGELDDLVAEGWVTPPSRPRHFEVPEGEVDHANTATNALIAMREEERW